MPIRSNVVVGAYYDKWTDSYGTRPARSTSFGNITTDVPTMFYTLCLRTKKGEYRINSVLTVPP